MPYQMSLRHAMERSAREIAGPPDVAGTLHTIVEAARRSMPAIDHVSVTIADRSGGLGTMAGTGRLVLDLDDLQYALAEGPCVHAVRSDPVVVVEHARREQRWPRYIPAAVRAGLRSQVGLRLYVAPDESLGSFNLYSTTSSTIPLEIRQLAKIFAAHVTVVLKHVLLEKSLSTALQPQTYLGTAVGIVRQRHGLDNEQAFAYLARVSQHSNLTLTDVARGVVAGARDSSPVASPDRLPAGDVRGRRTHGRQTA